LSDLCEQHGEHHQRNPKDQVGGSVLSLILALVERYFAAWAELAAPAEDCAQVLGPEHPDTLIARRETGLSCLHSSMSPGDADPARLAEAVRRLEELASAGGPFGADQEPPEVQRDHRPMI
jgi:hypothetical protein